MKKCCLILILALMLTGCGAGEVFETVADDYAQPAMQTQRGVLLTIPEEAAAQTVQSEAGTLYLCDGYEVTVEVLNAGNLSATFQNLTGFGTDDLTVMATSASGVNRYECVWTAAGEGGDTVGRAAVLDDGVYHYCLTVMANAGDARALQETWQVIFDSFALA